MIHLRLWSGIIAWLGHALFVVVAVTIMTFLCETLVYVEAFLKQTSQDDTNCYFYLEQLSIYVENYMVHFAKRGAELEALWDSIYSNKE